MAAQVSSNEAAKIAVLMSGGVDSSLAAALLQQQNREIVGVTLQLRPLQGASPEERKDRTQSLDDARRVVSQLGIEHRTLDVTDEFARLILQPFRQAYRQGHTPNPCIRCNRLIKFDLVLQKMRPHGVVAVATGHYARLEGNASACHLKRAADRDKDQSYFLYAIGRQSLPRVLFPVGHLRKSEARRLAEQLGLPVAHKSESQDFCFLAGEDYRQVVPACGPGPIVDPSGRVLGTHPGVEHFTVGQRKGIGLSGGPYYVLQIDPATNTLIVGPKKEGYHSCLEADEAVWLESVRVGQEVEAQIRSRHRASPATVESIEGGRFRLRFPEPQWAITPGQSAVLYAGDLVLGGGIIRRAA